MTTGQGRSHFSPVFRYVGGKSRLVKKILPFLPPHKIYVEAFGGAASVLLAKPKSEFEVYNDINSDLANFFSVLSNEQLFCDFYSKISRASYSKELYEACKRIHPHIKDSVKRAAVWFYVQASSYRGLWGTCWQQVSYGDFSKEYYTRIKNLPKWNKRLLGLQVYNLDYKDIIKRFDSQDTLFYIDPPYLIDGMTCKYYKNNLTPAQHLDLVKILLRMRGMVLLSGYPNRIYKILEANGWRRIDFGRAVTLSSKRECKRKRVPDAVWLSPNATNSLFL